MRGGFRANSGRKRGRKSARQEANTFKELLDIFHNKVNTTKLKKLIDSGKYSGKDVFAYQILVERNKDAVINLIKKVVSDSVINDVNISNGFEAIKLDK